MNTPWGIAQSTRTLAEGITLVSTASHGGIHLSAEREGRRQAEMPSFNPFAGPQWYEEDEDACVCFLLFADEIGEGDGLDIDAAVWSSVRHASMAVDRHLERFEASKAPPPSRWQEVLDWLHNTEAGQARLAQAARYEQSRQSQWELGGMGTAGVPGFRWWATYRQLGTGKDRQVCLADYPEQWQTTEQLDEIDAEARRVLARERHKAEQAKRDPDPNPGDIAEDYGGAFDGNSVTSDADPGL